MAASLGRWVVALVLVGLTALALAGFDVWGGAFTPAQMRPAVWLGQAFLAACLYLFLGLEPVWLVCVGIWLVRWRHDHGRDGRRRLNRVASPLVAAVAVAVTAYGAVEAASPSVTRFEVASAGLPAQFDGVRVALVTDLHAGAVRSAPFTREVVDLVNAEQPDVVVIAGDLVDGDAARYLPEIAPLADLRAPLGVFATTGNHEMFRGHRQLGHGLRGRGPGRPAELGGAAGARRRQASSSRGWTTPRARTVGAGLRRRPRRTSTPAASPCSPPTSRSRRFDVEGRGVDLQVSGHTHGGQMWPINHLVPLQQPMLDGTATVGHTTGSSRRAAPGRGARRSGWRRPGGPDHHPEAVVSGPGVVVGTTAWPAQCGRRSTRCCASTTTRSGGCRCATSAACSSGCHSRRSSPACRG